MIVRMLICLLFLVGCGGGSSVVNCTPTKVTPCHPTAAGGCTLRGAAGAAPAVTSVLCSGGDASTTCQPSESTECVDACKTTSYNCEDPS
jgi:hypothetical protein